MLNSFLPIINNLKMMKKLIFILLPLVLVSLGSCEERGRYMDRKSENLYLRQLTKSKGQTSESKGSFFFLAGSYSSKTEEKTVVQVFANVGGEYRFIEMPIENIRIKIDPACQIPYLILNYRSMENIRSSELLNPWHVNSYTIVCSEKYLPEKLLPVEL